MKENSKKKNYNNRFWFSGYKFNKARELWCFFRSFYKKEKDFKMKGIILLLFKNFPTFQVEFFLKYQFYICYGLQLIAINFGRKS